MNRLLLLSCSLATFAACDVGDVPSGGNNVVCEQPGVNADGHHRQGLGCLTGACHKEGSLGTENGVTAPSLPIAGTVYDTSAGSPKGTATVVISWDGGGVAKFVTATGPTGGEGNFYDYAAPTGITFPATVRVSLCPDPDKVMQTKLNSAADLDCSRSGCHTSTLKIFLK